MKNANFQNKLVILRVGEQLFSLPSQTVCEVLDLQTLTTLPFVPDFIDGLVNIKGSIIPQLDLERFIFGRPAASAAVIAVIEIKNSQLALRVDEVIDEVTADESQLRLFENSHADSGISHVGVIGEFLQGTTSIMMLDATVFDDVIQAPDIPDRGHGLLGNMSYEGEQEEFVSCLEVEANGERYGFWLEHVVEMVPAQAITPIPGAPACVRGIVVVRKEPLLVLSFNNLIGKPEPKTAANIVIVERQGVVYGLEIESGVDIVSHGKNQLKSLENERSAHFEGMLVNAEDRVTLVIALQGLIPDALHQAIKSYAPARQHRVEEEQAFCTALKVTIENSIYALPVEAVRQVTAYHEHKTVNDDNKYISGIVEFGEKIVSVIDLESFIGTNQQADQSKAYVIVGNADTEWAIRVGEANSIIDIPLNRIENVDNASHKYISGIAHVNGELFSVLDVNQIYSAI